MPDSAAVTATAPAKINLALRVGAVRKDGFHPLATVFHAVDLLERVSVGPLAAGHSGSIRARGVGAHQVPLDGSNLAWRAAALLRRELRLSDAPRRRDAGGPVAVRIDKRIPVAGGLAGGSADAAAALVALNQLWGMGLTRDRLVELAGELGSDVPFAVLGGNALGEGRGERLTPLASPGMDAESADVACEAGETDESGVAGCRQSASAGLHWVLLTSPTGLSTAEVFREFDRAPEGAAGSSQPPPVPSALLDGLAAGDPRAVGANLVNDLQPVAFSLRPELADLAARARAAGACGVVVSGSGPTLACLAPDAAAADALAKDMSRVRPPAQVIRASGPASGASLTPAI